MIGSQSRTIDIKVGLDDDNRPIFEGHTIWKGGRPFKARIREDERRACVDCGREKSYLSGVFHVGVTEYQLIVSIRRIEFINFECLECLHDRDPEQYPYPNLKAAYG